MSGPEDDDLLVSRGDRSKQRKTEEKRLAALATTLVGLSNKQIGMVELDEEVSDAVDEARRVPTHTARARQLRVVRRALRGSDSLAIASAVEGLFNRPGAPAPAAGEAQHWVNRLLTEGSEAVEDFLVHHVRADRQRLRGLIRNAHKTDAKKSAKARKTLNAAVQALIRETESDP
ncbi:MAG: DUF615 domain-containing protein [Deltaproteobacteria bacterium]|nr:DUF615 domain-containing protein [Deltaproteobacteria bacterium]